MIFSQLQNIYIMKFLLKFSLIVLFACTVTAQNNSETALALNTNSNAGVFEFQTETIDYGTINQNSNGNRTFVFKNNGNSPIIISKTKGSCGCTVATAPTKPIMPGETAEINVKYATNRVGSFSKTITLTSNASEKIKTIKIKGTVLKADTQPSVAINN